VQALRRRWLGLIWAAGVAVVTAVFSRREVTTGSISLLVPIAAGAFAATAALSASAYRDRRDPGLLFVSVGASAVAVQYALWHVLIPIVWTSSRSGVPAYLAGAVYGATAGAFVLVVCLGLAAPWRDRRGRPAVRPALVVGIAGGAVAAFDLLLLLVRPADPIPAFLAGGVHARVLPTLSVAVIAAAAVTVVHTFDRPGWYRWVAGAAAATGVAAIGTAVTYLATPRWTTYLGISWQNVMPAAAAALLLAGVVAVDRADVTRMRRASDKAAAVLAGRSEIASVIAHDVRGPASSIKSIAASTRTNYDRLGDAERLEFVGMIEHEAARLLQLVGQMSLALKVDAGSLEYQLRVQPLGPILATAVHDAEITERAVDVDVSADADADVDARWLAEAIGQGLDNATKFSPDGAPVRLMLLDDGSDAVIQIADAGPGVPPEVRDEVFEKFARWRPPGYEDRPGSGLGLFITRSIARELGGDAVLGSAASGGTILRIRIPKKG
jgi:signal transduction histidine kinase